MKRLLLAMAGLGVAVAVGAWVAVRDNPAPPGEALQFAVQKAEPASEGPAAITLAPRDVSFADGTQAALRLPEGFEVAVAAEGLGKARFMTLSPDGRLFVPDMVDYALSREGRVLILGDFDEETKRFATAHTYLSGLRGPNSILFHTDEVGDDWLYLALTEHIVRYPYEAGDTEPSGPAEVVYEFPNAASPNADSAVWHLTRTMLLDEGTLYVGVGSGCNACEQPADELRALILAMNPDGTDARVYAYGIKNPVGLGFADGALYATDNGVDHLGEGAPDDRLLRVEEGAHYGWPYCYETDGETRADDSYLWESAFDCAGVPLSFAAFPAHSAPLGFAHFGADAHETLRGSFLVALQGSWNPEIGNGYRVVRVSESGEQEVFMDGFMTSPPAGGGERVGQPVHILQKDTDSFFVTDDLNGRLYYVYASS